MRPTLYVFGTKTLNAEFEFSYFRIEYLCKIQIFFICVFPTFFCPVNPRYKFLKEKRLIWSLQKSDFCFGFLVCLQFSVG